MISPRLAWPPARLLAPALALLPVLTVVLVLALALTASAPPAVAVFGRSAVSVNRDDWQVLELVLKSQQGGDARGGDGSAIGSDSESNTSWMRTWRQGAPCSTLEGVRCDSAGRVSHIFLGGVGLIGRLWPELSHLPALQQLDLSNNWLTGTVPTELSVVAGRVTKLDLSGNRLYGSLPSDFVVPSYFDVSGNQLTGPLPPVASRSKSVVYNVASNYFTGPDRVPAAAAEAGGQDLCPNLNNGLSSNVERFGSLAANCLSPSASTAAATTSATPSGTATSSSFVALVMRLLGQAPEQQECPHEPQRFAAECAGFCGATAEEGVCGGRGVCRLAGHSDVPTCECERGFVKGEDPGTCVAEGSEEAERSSRLIRRAEMLSTKLSGVNRHRGLQAKAVTSPARLSSYFRFAALNVSADRFGRPVWGVARSVDWRFANALNVTAPDQRNCNSSWAFAAVTPLESVWNRSRNLLFPRLSVQQVIDCQGSIPLCTPGNPVDAYEYIARSTLSLQNGGLDLDASYPYKGQTTIPCQQLRERAARFGMLMYEKVEFNGYLGLVKAVQGTPVSIALQADASSFVNYAGGYVYGDAACYTGVVNHGVVVVGYNLVAPRPYFIIRNSWGTNWGENGYMRIAITPGVGTCGMFTLPAYYPQLPAIFTCTQMECGSGTCIRVDAPLSVTQRRNVCTKCPTLYSNVTNIDNSSSCVPTNICVQTDMNPCGAGYCVPTLPGLYKCVCPTGYFNSTHVDGSPFCSPNTTAPAQKNLCSTFFTVSSVRETCQQVVSQFAISIQRLHQLNPGIACAAPLTAGLSVCVSIYPSATKLALPVCTKYQAVRATDTCRSIWQSQSPPSNSFQLYAANPGMLCSTLVPQISTPGAYNQGQQVCVATATAPTSCPNGNYTVQLYDNCPSIVASAFGGSLSKLRQANNGFVCESRRLFVGQVLCLP